jgi:hypothetical protein
MPMRKFLLIILVLSMLSSCGGPRYTKIPWVKALKLDAMMELKILAIYDGLHHSREPHVTHLVEVEIIDGPGSTIGQRITLPYDKFNTRTDPPAPGEIVFVAPSSWLKRSR